MFNNLVVKPFIIADNNAVYLIWGGEILSYLCPLPRGFCPGGILSVSRPANAVFSLFLLTKLLYLSGHLPPTLLLCNFLADRTACYAQ